MQEVSPFQGNTPSVDATSTPDMNMYDDDESVSLSDIDAISTTSMACSVTQHDASESCVIA